MSYEQIRRKWLREHRVSSRDKDDYKYETLPSESLVFNLIRTNELCILHFFHPDFPLCRKMDSHLAKIAEKLVKTVKIARISVEASPFLVQRFQIRVLPTLFLIKGGTIIKRMRGFEHIAQTESIRSEDLMSWITRTLGSQVASNSQSLISMT